ncbi:MAG: hypothetical protein KAT16_06610 [Candidatus Heimdallarchaeota archaeon]|nr:hypothetical protein [Candidatus Heimdallarchaeota archaeon]
MGNDRGKIVLEMSYLFLSKILKHHKKKEGCRLLTFNTDVWRGCTWTGFNPEGK